MPYRLLLDNITLWRTWVRLSHYGPHPQWNKSAVFFFSTFSITGTFPHCHQGFNWTEQAEFSIICQTLDSLDYVKHIDVQYYSRQLILLWNHCQVLGKEFTLHLCEKVICLPFSLDLTMQPVNIMVETQQGTSCIWYPMRYCILYIQGLTYNR